MSTPPETYPTGLKYPSGIDYISFSEEEDGTTGVEQPDGTVTFNLWYRLTGQTETHLVGMNQSNFNLEETTEYVTTASFFYHLPHKNHG